MSSSRTGCLRFRADAAFCSLCSPCFRPPYASRARRRFALFCAAFAAEPEVSSGWALPVVERGRGLGSLRRLVRYPVACASVNANLCSGAPLCAGTAVPRQRPTGAVRSSSARQREPGAAPSPPRAVVFWKPGQAAAVSDQRERLPQFRAGARTGSRAVAAAGARTGSRAVAAAGGRFLEAGTGGCGQRPTGAVRFSSAREREPAAAPSRPRQIFYIQVVRPDLRDATPGRAMRLATPSRRKAAFSCALRRTR